MRTLHVCLVGLLVLAACGDADETLGSASGSGPIEIVTIHEAVEYYGACGNETLTVDDVTYYPVHNETYPGNNESFPKPDFDRYPVVGSVVGTLVGVVGLVGMSASPRVPAPGPGDDVGELIVYADGIARFESESGWVIWLTDEEQTYGWVC
jgi:hypothetical protein